MATTSGEKMRQQNCMKIWREEYNVVNWHFQGTRITSIDHHASYTASFCVIVVSTPPSDIQDTKTNTDKNLAQRQKNCLCARLSAFSWGLAELLPGGLFSDQALGNYMHPIYKPKYLENQDEFLHSVKTDTSIWICCYWHSVQTQFGFSLPIRLQLSTKGHSIRLTSSEYKGLEFCDN